MKLYCCIVESEKNDSDEQTTSKKSTPTSCTDESIASQVLIPQTVAQITIIITPPDLENDSIDSPVDDVDENDIGFETEFEGDSEPETNTITITTTTQHKQQEEQNNSYNSHSGRISVIDDLPAKSCLSPNNSMHKSSSAIKKKVNISEQAEIIELERLPLPSPYAVLLLDDAGAMMSDPLHSCNLANYNQQSGDNDSNYDYEDGGGAFYENLYDDDEVFSDSIPAPKRESMCAPYILSSSDISGEVFTHGLPDWFNDERINEK